MRNGSESVRKKPQVSLPYCIHASEGKNPFDVFRIFRKINFINFKGVEKLDWTDADGTQAMPKTRRSVAVRQYVSRVPGHVYLASPDLNGGIMEELTFTSGKDLRGNFISFVMPELRVWNTVYLAV
jgi:hypothetical protein